MLLAVENDENCDCEEDEGDDKPATTHTITKPFYMPLGLNPTRLLHFGERGYATEEANKPAVI